MAGQPPWMVAGSVGPTAFRLRRVTPTLAPYVGSRRLVLKTRPWRGWLPSINMRGGASFHGMISVKEKRDEATLSRCSLSPLVEVLGLEEFGFEL